MGNVVQSDIKGIQLFLGELDKGDKRKQEAIKAAQDASRDQFNQVMKLADRGLIARVGPDGNQIIEKMTEQEDVVFRSTMERNRNAALFEADTQNVLQGIADKNLINALNTPEREAIRGFQANQKLKNDQALRLKNSEDIRHATNEAVKLRESETGKKATKIELKDIADKTAAKFAGQSFAKAGEDRAAFQFKLNSQASTLLDIRKLAPGMDLSHIEASLADGVPVDKTIVDKAFSEALSISTRRRESDAEKEEMLNDIKLSAGNVAGLSTKSSIETIKAVLENIIDPKGSSAPLAEVNSFNADVKTVVKSLESVRSLKSDIVLAESFIREIQTGDREAFIEADDADVRVRLLKIFPFLKGVSSVDAGDDLFKDIQQAKAGLEVELKKAKRDYTVAGKAIVGRAGRHPEFSKRVSELFKSKILLTKKQVD